MAEHPDVNVTIKEPVGQLEREIRRWRRGAALLALGLMALIAMGQKGRGPIASAIEAQQFILRDNQGQERARLGVRANGEGRLTLACWEGDSL